MKLTPHARGKVLEDCQRRLQRHALVDHHVQLEFLGQFQLLAKDRILLCLPAGVVLG